MRTLHGWISCLILLAGGCEAPSDRLPEISSIYKEAALDEIRNPVIVIHGILGARLQDRASDRVVWGAFTDEGIDPETPEGARLVALPLEAPKSALDYDPNATPVYAAGPLEQLELSVFYQLISVEVYASIIRTLGAGGFSDQIVGYKGDVQYAPDHYTCFSFFYDWRRDNVENAIRLGRFIAEKRKEVEAGAMAKAKRLRDEGDDDLAGRVEQWVHDGFRFDIVAHSMGGLVARYFLRYGANDLPADGSVPEVTWKGAEEVDRLVMVGTPNLGSMDALRNLTEGFRPASILPYYDAALLGTMPSIYQLLPRTRHGLICDGSGKRLDVDLFDPDVWEQNEWGLFEKRREWILDWLMPGVKRADQRRVARDYARWCIERARQFHAALDSVPARPSPAQFYLFAADAEPTLARAFLRNGEDGSTKLDFNGTGNTEPGDHTVPRYSAIADERFGQSSYSSWLRSPVRWTNVTFLSDDHIGLTKNPHFVDNMLFILLEQQPLPR